MTTAVDSNTVAYLPLTTDLTDQCGNEWTAHGEAAVSGGALVLDGVDDFLQAASTSLGDITGDMTVEAYAYLDSTGSLSYPIVDKGLNTDATSEWGIQTLSGKAYGYLADTSSHVINMNGSSSIATDTFVHFALIRSGTSVTVTVGGTVATSGTLNSATAINAVAVAVRIGANGNTTYPRKTKGKIKHVRISKVARYTSFPFTPPTFGDESITRRRVTL